MEQSLMEWGVRKGKNDIHATFHKKALEVAGEHSSGTQFTDAKKEERPPKLPMDVLGAVEHVLEDAVDVDDDERFWETVDNLSGPAYPPFFSQTIKTDRGTTQTVYKLNRHGYSQFKIQDLDPFHRFARKGYEAAEWFYQMFQDRGSLDGYIFEAFTAYYMQNQMHCHSCKFRNCLRWNGGFGGPWSDVICVHCPALYEIKSKADEDAIERAFRFNAFQGGSFRFFNKNTVGDDRVRYLVVVSRKASMTRSVSAFSHRVSLAEIKTVVPRLCPESFIDIPGAGMRVLSKIAVNISSVKKTWCRMPSYGLNKAREVARKVYAERFGPDTWNSFAKEATKNVSETNQPKSNDAGPSISNEETTLSALYARLDQLKLNDDDDWEAYDSE